MLVQTTFPQDLVRGVPGQLADNGPNDTVSRISRQTAAIPFGTFVSKRNTEADGNAECGNPTATADVTARGLGIALKSELCEEATGYKTNEGVQILRKGRCYVTSETATTAGATAFVRFTVEAPDLQLGLFRNDADTDKAVACPGVVFLETLSAAGLVLVEVNLPQ
jgi:hypothetical protein